MKKISMSLVTIILGVYAANATEEQMFERADEASDSPQFVVIENTEVQKPKPEKNEINNNTTPVNNEINNPAPINIVPTPKTGETKPNATYNQDLRKIPAIPTEPENIQTLAAKELQPVLQEGAEKQKGADTITDRDQDYGRIMPGDVSSLWLLSNSTKETRQTVERCKFLLEALKKNAIIDIGEDTLKSVFPNQSETDIRNLSEYLSVALNSAFHLNNIELKGAFDKRGYCQYFSGSKAILSELPIVIARNLYVYPELSKLDLAMKTLAEAIAIFDTNFYNRLVKVLYNRSRYESFAKQSPFCVGKFETYNKAIACHNDIFNYTSLTILDKISQCHTFKDLKKLENTLGKDLPKVKSFSAYDSLSEELRFIFFNKDQYAKLLEFEKLNAAMKEVNFSCEDLDLVTNLFSNITYSIDEQKKLWDLYPSQMPKHVWNGQWDYWE